MASLRFDPRSGYYFARFRFQGREYSRSLKTGSLREARGAVARLDDTLRLIEQGRLEVPVDADWGEFLLSEGKITGREKVLPRLSLSKLFELYEDSLPAGSKEDSTLKGERTHFSHLKRHLGKSTVAQELSPAAIQGYVATRSRDKWHGKNIQPETIKKELTTLRLVWNWGVNQGVLQGQSPVRGVKYPKRDEKLPFMTREEIEHVISRGGLSDEEVASLWDSLFLRKEEITDLLSQVERSEGVSLPYAMLAFVADTGARRSEVLRSRIDDFDFRAGTVLIREKKRSRANSTSYRRVDLTSRLKSTMTEWFERHPGGQYTLCNPKTLQPLTVHEAHRLFKRTLKGTRWSVVRGFHVFRHSFASNLAALGVDQRFIDEWLGHQTEEMRRRYRHLLPDLRRKAIEGLATA